MEVDTITTSQGTARPAPLSRWGKAVPSTKAPMRNPSAPHNPFSYHPAAIFIPRDKFRLKKIRL